MHWLQCITVSSKTLCAFSSTCVTCWKCSKQLNTSLEVSANIMWLYFCGYEHNVVLPPNNTSDYFQLLGLWVSVCVYVCVRAIPMCTSSNNYESNKQVLVQLYRMLQGYLHPENLSTNQKCVIVHICTIKCTHRWKNPFSSEQFPLAYILHTSEAVH